MKKLILDLSGGDNSASVICEGAFRALSDNADLFVTFVGPEKDYSEVLASRAYLKDRFDLIPCDDVLTNEDNPMLAAKPGAGYTMAVALETLSKTEGPAAITPCCSGTRTNVNWAASLFFLNTGTGELAVNCFSMR